MLEYFKKCIGSIALGNEAVILGDPYLASNEFLELYMAQGEYNCVVMEQYDTEKETYKNIGFELNPTHREGQSEILFKQSVNLLSGIMVVASKEAYATEEWQELMVPKKTGCMSQAHRHIQGKVYYSDCFNKGAVSHTGGMSGLCPVSMTTNAEGQINGIRVKFQSTGIWDNIGNEQLQELTTK